MEWLSTLLNSQPFIAVFLAMGLGYGFAFVFAGMIVLLTVVLIFLLVGYFLLKMNFDDLLGIASGTTGNPAILAYANSLAPTGKPDIKYAMILPGVGTIVKIVAVQILAVAHATAAP